MNKYENAKIYKIVDNGYNMVYYGSTVDNLSKRFSCHKSKFKRNNKPSTSKLIFDKYGVENCKIELVENYPCNTREELTAREGYYIKNNDCVNKFIAGRTDKEYYENNKKQILEKNKEYKQANKEQIAEYNKQFYEDNKEKILNKVKEYRENNKEKIAEQKKQYYQSKKKLSHQN